MNSVAQLFFKTAQASPIERAATTYERATAAGAVATLLSVGRLCLAVVGWIPITPLAAGGLVAGWFLWDFAGQHGDHVLWGAIAIGLGLIGLSSVVVLVMGLILQLRPQTAGGPVSAQTGMPLRSGFELGIAGWNPLVRIEISWQRPVAGAAEIRYQRGVFFEEVVPSERALVSQVERQYVVRDVFGLARVRFRRRSPLDLKIQPHCGRAQQCDFIKQQVSGDIVSHPQGKPEGDLLEMRRYTPGDPLKLVLWKLYARSGQLLVRTPERAISTNRNTMVYLASAKGDEPAAGVCRAALLGPTGSGRLFGTDGNQPPTSNTDEALDQVARSSAARREGGAGLARLLATGTRQNCRSCVLFVPPQPGPWLDRVTAALAAFTGTCTAVIGIDGSAGEAGPAQHWSRWLLDSGPSEQATAAQLQETRRQLESAGAKVLVIDRLTGTLQAPSAA